jgi:hypothetical protein
MRSVVVILVSSLLSQGCLVLSLHPVYEDDAIAWDESLLGEWEAPEDNVRVVLEKAEWRSYRVRYEHPVETAEFTAYLTAVGDDYFMDLMPARGHDYGAVLVPAHLVVRLRRSGERWQVSSLDYDRLHADALRRRHADGAAAAIDQKHNVILTWSTGELRDWLRLKSDAVFGEPVGFERRK